MTILEQKLLPFTNDLKLCIDNRLYYAALTLALTLPDICSSLSNGGKTNGKKYSQWLDNYFFSIHEYNAFNSKDLYALRCSFLHNGLDEITKQRARDTVNDFNFFNSYFGNSFKNIKSSYTINGVEYHRTLITTDMFCNEMIESVINFIKDNKHDRMINNEALNMMSFVNDRDGFTI